MFTRFAVAVLVLIPVIASAQATRPTTRPTDHLDLGSPESMLRQMKAKLVRTNNDTEMSGQKHVYHVWEAPGGVEATCENGRVIAFRLTPEIEMLETDVLYFNRAKNWQFACRLKYESDARRVYLAPDGTTVFTVDAESGRISAISRP